MCYIVLLAAVHTVEVEAGTRVEGVGRWRRGGATVEGGSEGGRRGGAMVGGGGAGGRGEGREDTSSMRWLWWW